MDIGQKFERKGKKYRKRYFNAMDALYKDVENETPNRGSGTGSACPVDEAKTYKVLRDSKWWR